MNKKIIPLIFPIALLLSSCATVSNDRPSYNGAIVGILGGKSPVDLTGVTYYKDLATTVQEAMPKKDATYPTTILLLSPWNLKNPLVIAKNKAVCKGWGNLKASNENDRANDARDAKKIYNYMLVNTTGLSNPTTRNMLFSDCDLLLKTYNYIEAKTELNKIISQQLPQLSPNDAPYLAIYASQSSPFSSMILPLGDLSTAEIEVLVADWENLISEAYRIGEPFDPYLGLGMLIKNHPKIPDAKRQNLIKNIQIVVYVGTCGATLTPPFSLATLISTPACVEAYNEIRQKIGG